ncbi:MAG: SUMF1/EgtB/PvdO family nonheme iron enzyme [Oscillatoriophycideae cyanobacterium NC_groundwater_1537_Pr4_S-0.65um_50_18]|nr:SUMF1/EgtB/PvdO family nonheme iron enzyme [Oscillatoriophycideae cyanobacterium NC_groundwater_1537_Pr4_S-0.65um_50_18]
MVSPADQDALDGIRRIDRLRHSPAPPTSPPQRPRGARSPSPIRSPHLASRFVSAPISTLSLSRRRLLQIVGFSGAGLGTAFLGQALLRSASEPQTSKPLPSDSPSSTETNPFSPDPLASTETNPVSSDSPVSTELKLETFEFTVVTVDAKGQKNKPEQKQAQFFKEDLDSGVVLDMVMIPDGTFQMGSPETELARSERESPQHPVTVQSFLMGKFQVTQAQWKAVAALPKVKLDLKSNPSDFKGSDRPVENISWNEAVEFCDRLSKKTGRQYRLPSEAEWEYACRAGTETPFHFGDTITVDIASFDSSRSYGEAPVSAASEETTPVGSFEVANAFGLYDMHGNVREWCADHWHENYQGAPDTSKAWLSESTNQPRIQRGGSWRSSPRFCRSAARNSDDVDIRCDCNGFRVVCSVPEVL